MTKEKSSCVLGLAPSSRGVGFAVLIDGNVLHDWGVKSVKSGDKNDRSLSHVCDLIELHKPNAIALEDAWKSSLRSKRVQELQELITETAKAEGIKVQTVSRTQLNLRILKNKDGTRHQIAGVLAAKYSRQLGFRLPTKRRAWTSDPYQMDI